MPHALQGPAHPMMRRALGYRDAIQPSATLKDTMARAGHSSERPR